MSRMFLFFLLICFTAGPVAAAENKSEEQFYPRKLPEQFKNLNQEQNWQLLLTVHGPAQFGKKAPKWLDILLGEKTEPDRFLASPTSIAVMKGKAYVLDGDTMWIFDFASARPKLSEIKRKYFANAFGIDADGKFLYLSYPLEKKIEILDENLKFLRKIDCVFSPQKIKVKGDKIYAVDQGLQRLKNEPSPESVFILDKNTGKIAGAVGMPPEILKEYSETGNEKVLEKKELQQIIASSDEEIKNDAEKKKNGTILLHQPADVDVDEEGNLYVSEETNGRILKFGADGKFLGQFGIRAPNILGFDNALAVAVAPNGDVYGLDTGITLTGQSKRIIHLPYVKVFPKKTGQNFPSLPYAVWGGESVSDETAGGKTPNMVRPSDIVIDAEPENVGYFQKLAAPDFEIEYLVWIVSRGGAAEKVGDKLILHGKVLVFGYGKKR